MQDYHTEFWVTFKLEEFMPCVTLYSGWYGDRNIHFQNISSKLLNGNKVLYAFALIKVKEMNIMH